MTDYDVIESLQVWWPSQVTLQALFSDGKLWHLQARFENTLLHLPDLLPGVGAG